ncbi:hypothetical protein [Streptomyces orinoci]|uniref:Lipoprotein n=1 Tax=Streptomyces orinoci TaxID=67339 RepID=A0ABV3JTJ3_STRON|nr:hypothetical protein [Streptomyces orinoci]
MAVRGHGRGRVAATVALGVLLAGCATSGPGQREEGAGSAALMGSAEDPARALAAVRAVPAVLARAGGAWVRTAMETESGGTRLTIRGSGVYDFARPVGELTVLAPGDVTGALEHRPITEVFIPGALYMKNRGAGVPADKWVRLETGALGDGDLLTSGATDPLAAAELLAGAREVAYLRDETVDGARVRHYWGTVDLKDAARRAPARDRAVLLAAARGFSGGTVAFDASLDEQGRARVLRYRFRVRSRDGRGRALPGTVVSTVELVSFGAVRPRVRLPVPGDIYAGRVAAPQK